MNKDESVALQQKVLLLREEGKYKECIQESFHLLKWGTEWKDYKAILTAHVASVASYYSIGAMEEAFALISEYEEVCLEHGDDVDRMKLYNILFLLYEYTKEYDKAKETLKQTIELGLKVEKFNIVSNAYSNLSHVFLEEKNFQEALDSAILGLKMAERSLPERPILNLRVMLNLAQSYIGLMDLDRAYAYLQEMITNPVLDNFMREKAHCLMLQGSWYENSERYREAFESLSQAKAIVEGYKDAYLLKTIQEERCKLCDLMGDYQLGYRVQKEYIQLLNEINESQLAQAAIKLEVKHSLSMLKKKATTDYLTGLHNRSHLETTANEWLGTAAMNYTDVTCMVLDIDYFKDINDNHGHLFGDEVIKKVGALCHETMGEMGFIGRYGGDEFVILVKEPIQRGKEMANQLKEALTNADLQKEDSPFPVTVSIGVADNDSGTVKTFEEHFHLADLGLYEAKKNGRNQICVRSESVLCVH
ncbi:diguanylate cyclase [Fictibacillus iocasae]|uniref:Diguanylate cyclase n=1 Tax=Fictibacillus iocasae TaxID=2715437 RepID=A0ABW2NV68_9BACL